MTRAAPQEPAFKPEQILAHERSRIAGIYEAARKLQALNLIQYSNNYNNWKCRTYN